MDPDFMLATVSLGFMDNETAGSVELVIADIEKR